MSLTSAPASEASTTPDRTAPSWRNVLLILLLTVAALLVHGYHPFAEDAEIYLPGAQKILHPELFPIGAEFFQSHARLTFFPNLLALCVRITHLPFAAVLFVWQVLSIFLLLLACWQLSRVCFADSRACWAAVALVAALLTLPVAGTALYLVDQYVNPRNLAAFSGVFAIVNILERKYLRSGLWLVFSAAMHPFMTFFSLSYCVLLAVMQTGKLKRLGLSCWLLPPALLLRGSVDPYHEAWLYHAYTSLSHWAWYEWLGAVAPIALFWWFARLARRSERVDFDRMCRAFAIYNGIYLAGALVLALPKNSETLSRFQPLRCLHLEYIVMLVVGGGWLGQHVLKNRLVRWLALFVPLSTGMFLAQRALFAASAHVEWPWAAPKNDWVRAFLWARDHTPVNALFALDPLTMDIAGEDYNGFRCIAQRSMLADAIKDSGAVTMFPPLADTWWRQVQAQRGWRDFQQPDFQRLHSEFGVNWVVVQRPGAAGLDCPYENATVRVCRVE
jgi:hypothetical protein